MNGIRQNVRGPTVLLALILTMLLMLSLAGMAVTASAMHDHAVSAIWLPVAGFASFAFCAVRSTLRRRSAPWGAQRSWAKYPSMKLSQDDRYYYPASVKTKAEASWARPRIYYPTEKVHIRPALCLNTT